MLGVFLAGQITTEQLGQDRSDNDNDKSHEKEALPTRIKDNTPVDTQQNQFVWIVEASRLLFFL